VNRAASHTRPHQSDLVGRTGRIAQYLAGGAVLTVLYLAGHGLLSHHAKGGTAPAGLTGQLTPYSRVSTLLAHARAHDPALGLPHAHWFIRVRHGHAQVVVVDHSRSQEAGTTRAGHGSGRP